MSEALDIAVLEPRMVDGCWIKPGGEVVPVEERAGHWDTARTLGFNGTCHAQRSGLVRISFYDPGEFSASFNGDKADIKALQVLVKMIRHFASKKSRWLVEDEGWRGGGDVDYGPQRYPDALVEINAKGHWRCGADRYVLVPCAPSTPEEIEKIAKGVSAWLLAINKLRHAEAAQAEPVKRRRAA
jgi:hypothetical protein